MPQEQGYQSRVAPGNTAGLPQASADAFGAGVGEGVAQLGGALERRERVQRDAEANEQLAAASVALEGLKTETETYEAGMKDGSNPAAVPGGYGHHDIVDQFYRERAEQLLGTVTDKRVKQNLEQRLAAYGGDLSARTTGYEAGARALNTKTQITTYQTALTNRIARSDDPGALSDGISDFEEFVHGTSAPPELQDALLREGRPAIKGDYLLALAGKNPSQAKAFQASGEFDDIDPTVMERVGRTIEVREEQLRLAEEKKQRAAEVLDKEAEATTMGDIGRGVAVDPNVVIAQAQKAEARGDTSRAAELRAAAIGARVNTVYGNGNADAGQMTSRIAAIEGTKGWQANPDLVAEHSAIAARRDDLRKQPAEFAPIDLADPRQRQERSIAARAYASAHGGKAQYLGQDQAAEMANAAQSGMQGRLQVANALAMIEPADRLTALNQVAPKDAALRQAIAMPPRLRGELFRGEELRKSNSGLVPTKDVNPRWGERGQRAMAALPPEAQTAIFEGTKNIYAARAAQRGIAEFDQDLWDKSLDDVIDPDGGGGIGEHKGRPIIRPNGMTQRELDERWSYMPDNPAIFDGAKRAIPGREVRGGYHMVATARDGGYYLADDKGRFALNRQGGRFVLDVRRLTPPPRPAPAKVPASAVYVAAPKIDLGVAGPVYIGAPVKR